MSTGPHLHYEFRINGAHQNPMTVALPRANPLPRSVVARWRGENAYVLAQLESLDSGKLLSVTRMIDIPFAIEALRYFAGWSSKISGEYIALSPLVQDGASYRAYTERKPMGVVGGITPWNFPLGQAIQKLAPAIACGCTVVLKPSEETSLTTLRAILLISRSRLRTPASRV